MTALTCEMCGKTDNQVIKNPEYVGGKRYTTKMILCANRLACWLRKDKKDKGD